MLPNSNSSYPNPTLDTSTTRDAVSQSQALKSCPELHIIAKLFRVTTEDTNRISIHWQPNFSIILAI